MCSLRTVAWSALPSQGVSRARHDSDAAPQPPPTHVNALQPSLRRPTRVMPGSVLDRSQCPSAGATASPRSVTTCKWFNSYSNLHTYGNYQTSVAAMQAAINDNGDEGAYVW